MAIKILNVSGIYDDKLFKLLGMLAETVSGVNNATVDSLSQTVTLKIEDRSTEDTVQEVMRVLKKEFPSITIKWTEVGHGTESQPVRRSDFGREDYWKEQFIEEESYHNSRKKEEENKEASKKKEEKPAQDNTIKKKTYSFKQYPRFLLSAVGFVLSLICFGILLLIQPMGILSQILLSLSFLFSAASIFLLADAHKEMRAASLITVLISLILLIAQNSQAVLFIAIYHLGVLILAFIEDHLQSEVEGLVDIMPSSIVCTRGEITERLPASQIQIGDRIKIEPGMIPFDGIVREGESEIDRLLLTGDPALSKVEPGKMVCCGDFNHKNPIVIEVTALQDSSAAAKIRKVLLELNPEKSQYIPFTKWTLLILIAIEVLGGIGIAIISLNGRPYTEWLLPCLTLAAVVCPCGIFGALHAIRLANVGKAVKEGIIFSGVKALIESSTADTLALGFTGTLTAGSYEVIGIKTADDVTVNDFFKYAVSAENGCNHPIAQAIREYYEKQTKSKDLPEAKVAMPEFLSGYGVRAMIDRKITIVGNRKLMEMMGVEYPQTETSGNCIFVAVRNQYIGMFILNDPLLPAAKKLGASLHEAHVDNVKLLTGCDEVVVHSVEDDLEFDEYVTGQSETSKQEKLEEWFVLENAKGKKLIYAGSGDDTKLYQAPCLHYVLNSSNMELLVGVITAVIPSKNPQKLVQAMKISKGSQTAARVYLLLFFITKYILLACLAFTALPLYLIVIVNVVLSVAIALHTFYTIISKEKS